MSPMLVAIAPAKLLTISVITVIAAVFVIGTGLVMAVTGKVMLKIPSVQPAQPDRVRRQGAGLALIGIGVALLASGMYTTFANLESLPFFGAGLIVLLAQPAGPVPMRFRVVAFAVTFASCIGVWWALTLYLRP
jgi:hypothetical protein